MIYFLRHLIFCDEIATITSDDDFYVYQSNHEFEDSTIQIHEVYAISESIPWQVLKLRMEMVWLQQMLQSGLEGRIYR